MLSSTLRRKICPRKVKYDKCIRVHKKLPYDILTVNDKQITFGEDSGATFSVIRAAELFPSPKMSACFTHSVGASEKVVKKYFTSPLQCPDEDEMKTKHLFLLSKNCLINLLGRDLMIKLGISICILQPCPVVLCLSVEFVHIRSH